MQRVIIWLMLLFCPGILLSQNSFQFRPGKNKTVIPFKCINNLIFIPVVVNGVKLNFLLDTGVEETILFSLDDTDEIVFENAEKITFRGLGNTMSIVGLKTTHNKVSFRNFYNDSETIYVVLDQDFSLSSTVGIPVNGIIGHHFFENFPVEINYDKQKVIIHQNDAKLERRLRKFKSFPISIERNRPYVNGSFLLENSDMKAKLLLDTGNSDAVWLFEGKSDSICVPKVNFKDYLGLGLNGEVYGKRARISKFGFCNFSFPNPVAAFPEPDAIRNVYMVDNRLGSVGSEVLKRFTVVLDYKNQKMYLKKSRKFDEPFGYNVAGLSIRHNGLQWVKQTIAMGLAPKVVFSADEQPGEDNKFTYKFELKPVYKISSVRENSPADKAGLLKEDIVLKINGKSVYYFTLDEINRMLKSEEGERVTIDVERNGKVIKTSFRLISVL
jgi:hypothetical protein